MASQIRKLQTIYMYAKTYNDNIIRNSIFSRYSTDPMHISSTSASSHERTNLLLFATPLTAFLGNHYKHENGGSAKRGKRHDRYRGSNQVVVPVVVLSLVVLGQSLLVIELGAYYTRGS